MPGSTLWPAPTVMPTDALLSVDSFVVFGEIATVRPAGPVALKVMVSVPLEAAGSGESVNCG